MEKLLAMFESCSNSPAYIKLPQENAMFEGFVNGWAWAQATAKECLALRKLPELTSDYGPEKSCTTCHYFVLHFQYTGQYPWYEPVGCGHCTAPNQKKRTLHRDPTWRGCVDWRKREC
ncbi:MAG: hypothetical protein IJA11_08775 [Oscillospiraceae bacterium]|nr:hypothetical protein [Oscillospiraceae bacterium]